MKLDEENQLKDVNKEYSLAMQKFNEKNYPQASKLLNQIIEKYQHSEYYSVLEVHSRSKVYWNICQKITTPQKIELKNDEDYLQEAIFQLNAGCLEASIDLLSKTAKKKPNEPYIKFLLAIAFFKKEDAQTALAYLKECFELDNSYKILAFNEPDFFSLHENEQFLMLVE